MANPDWFDVEPADRETEAMMTFILSTCQDIKEWAYTRILTEGRKPGPTPKEVRREEWLNEYLRLKPEATDVPRFALRSSLELVMDYGKKKNPKTANAWGKFSVEPRLGWRKKEDREKVVSWEDWLQGKENASYEQRVTKEKTAVQLFSHNTLAFRWGRLSFTNTMIRRIRELAVLRGWEQDELIAKIRRVNFRRWRNRWQVNFTFAD